MGDLCRIKKRNWWTWITGGIVFVILLGFVLNTLIFYQKLNGAAKRYLCSNNQNQAGRVAAQLEVKRGLIEDFADLLSKMPEYLVTEPFLEGKAERFGFESMALVSVSEEEQMVCGEAGEALAEWIRGHEAEWRENGCLLLVEEQIIIAAPWEQEDGTLQAVAGMEDCGEFYAEESFGNIWEKGIVALRSQESGTPVSVVKGEKSLIHDRSISELLCRLEQRGYGGFVFYESRLGSAIPVEGTDLVQIMIVALGDLIPEISNHVLVYLILFLASFVMFCVGGWQIRRNTEREEQIFLTDPLTGGLNREGFLKTGGQFLTQHRNLSYAIVCMNICNFRRINEIWGEQNGNKTLGFVYRECLKSIDDREIVCRSTIDHFLLMLHGESEDEIALRVSRIIGSINTVIQENYEENSLDFMVGGCLIGGEMDLTASIRNAVYASKNLAQKNRCNFYNQEMVRKITYENELDQLFGESIKKQEFKAYLQPKVSKTECCQAEVLVRWELPGTGMVYPDQFIPMFEQNGKIVKLDLYIFEEACRLMAEWFHRGEPVTKLSVNISRFTLQTLGRETWKKYKEIKERYQVPDWLIEMEITETTLLNGNDITYIQYVLNGFHSCGLKVALDDFGFAYSSLGLLKSLEVDTIKLDRSFFIDRNYKTDQIVASIIQLSHRLGICVVAEGVEEEGLAELLYKDGCDFIQGYVYSKPLSVEAFAEWREWHEKQRHEKQQH